MPFFPSDEERLLRRAQKGDSDAFEALISPYERRIYALCLRMLSHHEDAQDAAQDAMIRLYNGLSSYRKEAALSSFIYRVTTNVCLDQLRKRKVRAGESLDALAQEGFSPTDDAPTPEAALLQGERSAALSRAIDRLPEEMRAALVLREIHQRSYEEIAQALSIGVGTVKSRLYRAREKLLVLLKEDAAFVTPHTTSLRKEAEAL